MKKFIIGFIVLIVILLVGLLALPSLIPSAVYKEKIETQLTKELAREVRVQGEVKLSVFPVIKANTGRVEIANPEGFSKERFAEMDAMSARVKLLPLFSKRVEIASFTLKNPSITLEKRKDGTTNWAFGVPDKEVVETQGPFKRDGRYKSVDPQIGNFALENGAISYFNQQSGTELTLSKVDVNFELPSLSDPIIIDGSLNFNDTPATIGLTLDSVRSFLDGKEAPVSVTLKTDFSDISAKGRFLPGEGITFNLDADAEISDMAKLAALSPTEVPYADLVNSAKLTGNYSYDGSVIKARGADIAAIGQDFNGAFKGNATLAETPVFDGRVDLDAKNIANLAKEFGQDIKGLSLLESIKFNADLSGQAKGFKAENISANIAGDGINGTFSGVANYGDALSAAGTFTARAASIPNILTALELDIPQAKAAKSLDASGQVSLAGDIVKLTNVNAKTEGGVFAGQYQGGASLGDSPAFDGTFNVAISSLAGFAAVTATEIPYAQTIGKIAIDGQVSGQGQNITLPRLTAALSDGQINGQYKGTAIWNEGASLDGRLDIDIPSLRNVATAAGTELPPSTKSGAIFERFSVGGAVKGSAENIKFSEAKIVMDHINGQGDFAVDMTSAKPFMTGQLDLEGLDLAPYMAAYSAQNPTGEIQPWSTAAINTAPLRAVDGDFTLNTPNIKTDRLTMGESVITSKLRGGVLTTNMPNIALYGGLGRMIAVLDGSKTEPRVSLDIGLNDLNSNSFLASAAGFTHAEGDLGSSFKITGSGASQAAIMKSLNGSGDFKLVDGLIKGVDLSALLTGLDQALTSRSIPSGIGPSHITKFKDLAGLVKIENGVASIDKFSLQGLGVLAEGSGQIDLGNQSIDFGLRPRLTGETANNIAAFGIPIEIKGGFGSAKVGLDTDMLGQIAAERARLEASKLIKDQVGGTVGDILGGVVGGTSESGTPKSQEEIIGGVLGGILGGGKPANDTPQETPEAGSDSPPSNETNEPSAQPEEPSVEDALLSIFGKKKEKKTEE